MRGCSSPRWANGRFVLLNSPPACGREHRVNSASRCSGHAWGMADPMLGGCVRVAGDPFELNRARSQIAPN
jgi:hypothetical protein